MEECRAELATLESLDSGAVYSLALKTHVGFSIDTFRYFADWADKIEVRSPERESHSGSMCTTLSLLLYILVHRAK